MIGLPSLPRIGVTPDVNDLRAPEVEYVIRRNYADAILVRGGLPFLLPYADDVSGYLAAIDGLLVTGGMFDIDPALYRQTARKAYVMKPERTGFEKALIEGALNAGLPVLGICNGMQLLAVCLGGDLIQDIPSDVPGALEHKPESAASLVHHEISIVGPSGSLSAFTGERFGVNSVHHQAVRPFTAYRPIAIAPDGVIEAIEAVGHCFALGVQWHPEYAVSAIDDAVLASFVAAAATFSRSRSVPSND